MMTNFVGIGKKMSSHEEHMTDFSLNNHLLECLDDSADSDHHIFNGSKSSSLDIWTNLPPECDTLTSLPSYIEQPVGRHSTGERKRPNRWSDFETGKSKASIVIKYPMANFVSCHSFSPTHSTFLAKLSHSPEPTIFHQTIKDLHWISAMDKEFDDLKYGF
ncbi:hypothetical protein AgCh_030690 [Apium graveolens]